MKEQQNKECQTCRYLIVRKRGVYSDIQWEKIKFCSRECFGKEHSRAMTGRKIPHPNWAGDKVKYAGLHIRIKKLLPKPKECMACGKETGYLDLANISQKYLHVISDWEYLCRRCHMKKDGRLERIKLTQFKEQTIVW